MYLLVIILLLVHHNTTTIAQWYQQPAWNSGYANQGYYPATPNNPPSSQYNPVASQYQPGYYQGGNYQNYQPSFEGTPEELYNVTTESPSGTGTMSPGDTYGDQPTTTEVVQATLVTDQPSQADLVHEQEFEKIMLEEVNKFRLMHGAVPLTLSKYLSKKAKLWAEKMARDEHESLNVDSPYGQLTFSTKLPVPNAAMAAVRHWYNRIKNYAWDKPTINTKSMQFTQLVWASSQQFGVGEASMGDTSYVVALFNPAGNRQDDLTKNVLPVTGSDATKRGPDSCPNGWHKIRKNCYRYFNNEVRWSEAVNMCDDEHSSLASLESLEEESSVRSIIAKDEGNIAWVGLSDRVNSESKEMIWVDGNAVKYENWNQYQDDDTTGQKCTTITTDSEGWLYKNCKNTLGFVCKKRLKDILSYMTVLTYPAKLWSENLRSEESPRYMVMKRHLDQAIMNLYNDDDWFVDMMFEGFNPTKGDKVSAMFKLRFSPDGDAPLDPLDKLRTSLETGDFIKGETLMLSHISLQNADPDSCSDHCLLQSCKLSKDCPDFCCQPFQSYQKNVIPPYRTPVPPQNSLIQPAVFNRPTAMAPALFGRKQQVNVRRLRPVYEEIQQEMQDLQLGQHVTNNEPYYLQPLYQQASQQHEPVLVDKQQRQGQVPTRTMKISNQVKQQLFRPLSLTLQQHFNKVASYKTPIIYGLRQNPQQITNDKAPFTNSYQSQPFSMMYQRQPGRQMVQPLSRQSPQQIPAEQQRNRPYHQNYQQVRPQLPWQRHDHYPPSSYNNYLIQQPARWYQQRPQLLTRDYQHTINNHGGNGRLLVKQRTSKNTKDHCPAPCPQVCVPSCLHGCCRNK